MISMSNQLYENRAQLLRQFFTENKIKYTQGWHNFDASITSDNAFVVQIDSLEQLAIIHRYVHKLNKQEPEEAPVGLRSAAGWKEEDSNCPVTKFFNCVTASHNKYQKYAASYTLNPSAIPDSETAPGIIFQFTPKFQQIKKTKVIEETDPNDGSKRYVYTVRAGSRFYEMDRELEKLGYKNFVESLIQWTTELGLAATGGNGSRRKGGCVAEGICSITIMDQKGNLYKITDDEIYKKKLGKDGKYPKEFTSLFLTETEAKRFFNLIRPAHMGLFGTVVEAEFECEPLTNMSEEIMQFNRAKDIRKHWKTLLEKDNCSLIYHPPYQKNPETPPLQAKIWQKTDEKPTGNTSHSAAVRFKEEFFVEISEDIFDVLTCCYPELIPVMTRLAAKSTIGARGTKKVVGSPKGVMHPGGYTTFPNKDIHDICYMLAVDHSEAPEIAAQVMESIESYLLKAPKKGQYPITLSTFLRYFKGLAGGLSATASGSGDGRYTLALDIVSHPDAPGLKEFHEFLHDLFVNEIGITPTLHPGKRTPDYVKDYRDVIGQGPFKQFKKDYAAWQRFIRKQAHLRDTPDPFISPYLQQMTGISPIPKSKVKEQPVAEAVEPKVRAKPITDADKHRALESVLRCCSLAEKACGESDEICQIRDAIAAKQKDLRAAQPAKRSGKAMA